MGGGGEGVQKQGPIYWKILSPLGGGGYQPMSFGGKNIKRQGEKGGNVKEKGRNEKEKGRKGKEIEKKGK
jgi:hypothetical protein